MLRIQWISQVDRAHNWVGQSSAVVPVIKTVNLFRARRQISCNSHPQMDFGRKSRFVALVIPEIILN